MRSNVLNCLLALGSEEQMHTTKGVEAGGVAPCGEIPALAVLNEPPDLGPAQTHAPKGVTCGDSVAINAEPACEEESIQAHDQQQDRSCRPTRPNPSCSAGKPNHGSKRRNNRSGHKGGA